MKTFINECKAVFSDRHECLVAAVLLSKIACYLLCVILLCYTGGIINSYLIQAWAQKKMVLPPEEELTKLVLASLIAWRTRHPRRLMRLPKRLLFSN